MKRSQYHEVLDRFKKTMHDIENGLPDILIQMYKQLMRKDDLNLRLMIAELYIVSKHYKDAVTEIEDIFELNPNFTQIYFLLSKIYSKNGQKHRIQNIFEQAFDQDIHDQAILDLLPTIYLEAGNTEKSIDLFSKLISINPRQIHYLKTLEIGRAHV